MTDEDKTDSQHGDNTGDRRVVGSSREGAEPEIREGGHNKDPYTLGDIWGY